MEELIDMVDQVMFTTTQKGYNPREVDLFIEQLKYECQKLADEYQRMKLELWLQSCGQEYF